MVADGTRRTACLPECTQPVPCSAVTASGTRSGHPSGILSASIARSSGISVVLRNASVMNHYFQGGQNNVLRGIDDRCARLIPLATRQLCAIAVFQGILTALK